MNKGKEKMNTARGCSGGDENREKKKEPRGEVEKRAVKVVESGGEREYR